MGRGGKTRQIDREAKQEKFLPWKKGEKKSKRTKKRNAAFETYQYGTAATCRRCAFLTIAPNGGRALTPRPRAAALSGNM
jgi:hypothetical protein